MPSKNLGRVSIVPKGTWNANTVYNRLDAVVHNGSSWLAKKQNTGQMPAEGSDDWQLLAERGADGRQGIDGAPGKGLTIIGHFDTVESLEASVTMPEPGDAYSIGDAEPYDIYTYDWVSQSWFNNGPIKGYPGPQGPKGDTGATGPKGDKGDKGDTGIPATILSRSVTYQVGDSGTVVPSGSWLANVPSVPQGKYLWTRTVVQFNTGDPITWYSVAYAGINGTGTISTVAGIFPDETGNVSLSAADVGARPNTWTPAASEVGAIPSTAGAVVASNIADSAVTRAKLANDALYSPFKGFDSSGTLTLSTDDIGKTIRTINGNVDYTINIARDTSMPLGAEVAVFRQQAKTINIVFGDNVRVAIPGATSYMPSPTLTIEPFTMIALKKLAADSTNDYWLVTGNVKVVS